MTDVNAASELVDDDVELAPVAAPELGAGVLRVCKQTCFVPGSPTLASSGGTPVYDHGPLDGNGLLIVGGNKLESAIVLNTGSRING